MARLQIETKLQSICDKLNALTTAEVGMIGQINQTMKSPFTFKGSVNTQGDISTLVPNPVTNDTVYVILDGYRMTYNGTDWFQSSLDEASYEDIYSTIREAIADQFDATKTYTVGQYVMSPNTHELYKCKNAVTTPLTWATVSSSFEKVAVGNEITELNELKENLVGLQNGSNNIQIGYYAKATENASHSIVIGHNVQTTNSNEIKIGDSTYTSLIICGKKIKFNQDGTVTWENV